MPSDRDSPMASIPCNLLLTAPKLRLITAAMPEAFPRSMLSPEGIRWFFGSFTENMESPWLVGLLLICIAWGTLQTSGLLHFDRTIYRHRNALRLVLIELVLFVAVILLLTVVPHAILLNVMGGIEASSFSRSILPYICFAVIVMSHDSNTSTICAKASRSMA